MSAFRVGQRVRLVRPTQPQNMGLEGRVYGIGPYAAGEKLDIGYFPEAADCLVIWESLGPVPCCAMFWQIEPIIPEGMQPVAWSECLWQPEGSGVTA